MERIKNNIEHESYYILRFYRDGTTDYAYKRDYKRARGGRNGFARQWTDISDLSAAHQFESVAEARRILRTAEHYKSRMKHGWAIKILHVTLVTTTQTDRQIEVEWPLHPLEQLARAGVVRGKGVRALSKRTPIPAT